MYTISALASSTSAQDTIANADWSAVTAFVQDGAAGKGISTVTEYYLATTTSTGVTTGTPGWTTSVQLMTSTNKYL